jgi:hypothetical protein
MNNFPDGHIMTNLRGHSGDVSYRPPERMSYYLMWQQTSNASCSKYLAKFQGATIGENGWEHSILNGTLVNQYLHGMAVLDEIQYTLVRMTQPP